MVEMKTYQRVVLVVIAAFALPACNPPDIIVRCFTSTPEYMVLGKTAYDQSWINRSIEQMVAGCKQPRPKARPVSFDKRKAVRPAKSKKTVPAKSPLTS
jgi:hypothetical protein